MVADRKLPVLSLLWAQVYHRLVCHQLVRLQLVRRPHPQLAQPKLRIRTCTGVPRK
jgi:hypothetical protein